MSLRLKITLAIMLMLFISISLILTEFLLAALFSSKSGDNITKYKLIQNNASAGLYVYQENSSFEYFGSTRSFDKDSILIDKHLPPPPKNYHKICVYGDSITRGFGLKLEETYIHKSNQSLIQQGYDKYRLLNMYRGYCPTNFVGFIKHDIKKHTPKTIMIQIETVNDLSDETIYEIHSYDKDSLPLEHSGGRYKLSLWNDTHVLSNIGLYDSPLERTIVYTAFMRICGAALNQVYQTEVNYNFRNRHFYRLGFDNFLYSEKRMKEVTERTINVISATRDYCKKQGIELIVLLTPSTFSFDPKRYGDGSLQTYNHVYKELTKRRVEVINILEALNKTSYKHEDDLFFDFCHINAEANEITAQKIVKTIKKQYEP